MKHYLFALSLACGLARGPVCQAHDGPEHVIEALTAEMATAGPSTELLYRRAVEHRALRRYDEAAADLEHALRIDAGFAAARLDLARLRLRQGKLIDATATLEPLIVSDDLRLQAAALATRGEIHSAQHSWHAAVADFTAALRVQPEVEWYVARAAALQALHNDDARVAGLRAGFAETLSPVLLRALVDALIDAGGVRREGEASAEPKAWTEAAAIIERELADCRYQSSWLLRRARLPCRTPAARIADFQAAIDELTARLDTPRPDPSLLDDRAAAYELLGDATRAEADRTAARAVRRSLLADASRPTVPTRADP